MRKTENTLRSRELGYPKFMISFSMSLTIVLLSHSNMTFWFGLITCGVVNLV